MRIVPSLVFAALILSGCSAFRGVWLDLHNADLTGETAPALTATGAVGPGSSDLLAGRHERTWRLLVFFLPT